MSTKELTNENRQFLYRRSQSLEFALHLPLLRQDLSISGFRLQLMADWFIWEMYRCFWQQLFLENVLAHWLVRLEWHCSI